MTKRLLGAFALLFALAGCASPALAPLGPETAGVTWKGAFAPLPVSRRLLSVGFGYGEADVATLRLVFYRVARNGRAYSTYADADFVPTGRTLDLDRSYLTRAFSVSGLAYDSHYRVRVLPLDAAGNGLGPGGEFHFSTPSATTVGGLGRAVETAPISILGSAVEVALGDRPFSGALLPTVTWAASAGADRLAVWVRRNGTTVAQRTYAIAPGQASILLPIGGLRTASTTYEVAACLFDSTKPTVAIASKAASRVVSASGPHAEREFSLSLSLTSGWNLSFSKPSPLPATVTP